jgi:hypothetical protein
VTIAGPNRRLNLASLGGEVVNQATIGAFARQVDSWESDISDFLNSAMGIPAAMTAEKYFGQSIGPIVETDRPDWQDLSSNVHRWRCAMSSETYPSGTKIFGGYARRPFSVPEGAINALILAGCGWRSRAAPRWDWAGGMMLADILQIEADSERVMKTLVIAPLRILSHSQALE